ncbi:adaptin ear-binding coat-associated protein 1-like isoform X2 [Tubulanus polymorphus]|uniref:adaptin ear-binding coat-associated protein 1-like isoform X2 n=1 Tax=Tubulanus polymorphus TaxID=672921 RepID=UPI003DA36835
MSVDYESVVCVKNEVFVYRIPPRTTNRGYRASDWSLDQPDWTGRMRVVVKGKDLSIKLEDKASGELFANAPIEEYPSTACESVLDSSRYFVIRIKDVSGRSAFIGVGFEDRSDAFDLNVSLQDHFKWLKKEKDLETQSTLDSGPKLDLGFKEGQTIKLNLHTKSGNGTSKARPRASAGAGGAIGILPPPPGGIKPPPSSGATSRQHPHPVAPAAQMQPQQPAVGNLFSQQPTVQSQAPPQPTVQSQSNIDLLLDLDAPGAANAAPAAPATDVWGDFASAKGGF